MVNKLTRPGHTLKAPTQDFIAFVRGKIAEWWLAEYPHQMPAQETLNAQALLITEALTELGAQNMKAWELLEMFKRAAADVAAFNHKKTQWDKLQVINRSSVLRVYNSENFNNWRHRVYWLSCGKNSPKKRVACN